MNIRSCTKLVLLERWRGDPLPYLVQSGIIALDGGRWASREQFQAFLEDYENKNGGNPGPNEETISGA